MYEPMIEPKSIQRDLVKQGLLNEFHEKRKDYLETIRGTYPEVSPKGVLFEKFDVKDAVVWIDPLDGTSDFVKGNLSAVTVLIGLSINGISRLGVVHNPFTDEDPSKGRTLFGTIEHGLLALEYDENMTGEVYRTRKISYLEPFDHLEVPKEDHTFVVAASLSHFNQQMKEIIDKISPVDIRRLGGAGNKCSNLALGRVDTYMHPSYGLKYWDLCAPEILIKAMGGYATNLKEQKLTYFPQDNRQLSGLIVGRNP